MSTKRVNELYETIRLANEELAKIRKECPHDNWFEGNYGWAPGHFNHGAICDDCGEFIGQAMTLMEWVNEMNEDYNRYNQASTGYTKPFERIKIDFDNTEGKKFTKREFLNEVKTCGLQVPKNLEKYLENWIKHK